MLSSKYPFLFLSLLIFAQPQLAAQTSLPNCGPKEERETICSLAGCNQLMIAAENGELNRVRELLEKGADVNARAQSGHTALILAANAGHLEVVNALLKAGADANVRVFTFHAGEFMTLMAAMNRCNKDWLQIMDAIIAGGAELNPTGPFLKSPLDYAITRYDPVLVKALIARGADVNLKDTNDSTALMTAIMSLGATVEIVKLLLAAGADPEARDKDGETALSMLNIYRREPTERAELSRLLRASRHKKAQKAQNIQ